LKRPNRASNGPRRVRRCFEQASVPAGGLILRSAASGTAVDARERIAQLAMFALGREKSGTTASQSREGLERVAMHIFA